jgi:hypothetical protein
MPKKKIMETHGKEEAPKQEKLQPTLLDQVWGADDTSRYGTLDESVYNKTLEGMTRADIEAHARRMGVVIVEHTPRLREKLLNEFRSYAALVRKPISTVANRNAKISDAAQKVLAEGR